MPATERIDQLIEALDSGPLWRDAACTQGAGTTAIFFSEQIPDIAMAKSICNRCCHVTACLAGALSRAEPWGVWGGELLVNGKILAQKRKRGRPPKLRAVEIGLSA